jgi:hypothetical protein
MSGHGVSPKGEQAPQRVSADGGPMNPLPRFVVHILAWLPVTFVVWYYAAPMLLQPAMALAALVLHSGFGDIVRDVTSDGATAQVLTTLRPGQAAGRGQVSVDVNMLLYAYGMPMYAALVLAARAPRWPVILVLGLVAMLPFVAWGIVADALKNLAITSGPAVASQTGFSHVQREVIAFAFQFGTLILPTVVPAAIWVLTHRRFLERLRQDYRVRDDSR